MKQVDERNGIAYHINQIKYAVRFLDLIFFNESDFMLNYFFFNIFIN